MLRLGLSDLGSPLERGRGVLMKRRVNFDLLRLGLSDLGSPLERSRGVLMRRQVNFDLRDSGLSDLGSPLASPPQEEEGQGCVNEATGEF